MSASESNTENPSGKMPLLQHLAELRARILWSAAAIAVASGVSFWFAEELIQILWNLDNMGASRQMTREDLIDVIKEQTLHYMYLYLKLTSHKL